MEHFSDHLGERIERKIERERELHPYFIRSYTSHRFSLGYILVHRG